ncbi:hypothetical protein [Halomonas sp. E19]|uniref:hypothetical protein n=1 Tax=Halomonas sp. E19 TaxID=3397247 RepID=UPI004033273E
MLGAAPFSPAASIALLMASACLMGGTATPRARLGWFWVGIAICLIGALSVLSVVWPHLVIPSPWGQAFTTPFTALPALLCGTAMLLLSRRSAAPLALNRAAVLALVGGVLASSLAWYALTWQQADAQRRHAAELLIHFKGASERAVDGQQRSLQRLAERWANLGGLPRRPTVLRNRRPIFATCRNCSRSTGRPKTRPSARDATVTPSCACRSGYSLATPGCSTGWR